MQVGADFTMCEGTLAPGDGIGVVTTGVGRALVVGTAVAVGLECGLPDEHAARIAVDAAMVPSLTRWAMNNLRRRPALGRAQRGT